ncbi:MAG TPA: ATP-binding protein [Pyrinomonadaceae bacterium]|nr:ATP-binding protein [Pyrinomonadaceae bacterium]
MEEPGYPKILADRAAADFAGRTVELERLLAFATSIERSGPLIVAGPPGVGLSELLKQLFDHLFNRQISIVPFYFALPTDPSQAVRLGQRFAYQFLLYAVAFRRRDPSIVSWRPDLEELAEIAPSTDGHWIDRIARSAAVESNTGNGDALLACLAAPARAAAAGIKSCVIIDDCHAAAYSDAAANLLSAIKEACSASNIPYILAARRRFEIGLPTASRMNIGFLPFNEASMAGEKMAIAAGAAINEECRDLITNQIGCRLKYFDYICRSAGEQGAGLDSFPSVQKVYAHEIFGGRIRHEMDSLLNRITPDRNIQKNIIGLLDPSTSSGAKQLSLESWLKRTMSEGDGFAEILERLKIEEMVSISDGRVSPATSDHVYSDYFTARARLDSGTETRGTLFGKALTEYLKRAPLIMARHYRKQAALGLRGLLSTFSLQQVPLAAIDHGLFAEHYKGLPDDEIMTGLRADEPEVHLPQIVYTANAADLYDPIGRLTGTDRSAVALGFQEGLYSDNDEVVWIAAEVDSKLEAAKETAAFWCDRLEMVALMCGFSNFRIWIIAPEGFTNDAMQHLRERGAFGSSRRQIGFLRSFLQPDHELKAPGTLEEYEVVIPMDDESEMIAANALEDIARRHNVPGKAINQLKTALLEASINAAEHSLSPDRRIRQKFRVEEDRFIINVSNRGIRIVDRGQPAGLPEGLDADRTIRRGWGMKLIEKLMDEVKIEHTDDGTSISMIKYLQQDEVPA